ncbi:MULTISPECIES: type II toxin-antitoxin system HicA family toxin [Photorhabdus]|uniref:type II toxin-antitoxin system HicA family toxin n=1 Tax=Photorhabdus TaxID=29487 RepID=UPI0009BC1987|nr:type II toxin-antitoxin system HicA family toxin [Photorhabdus luminescens]
MKSTDLIKELTAVGCEFKRYNGGDHQIWWSLITGKTFPVPHPKKDLPIGIVKSIKNGESLIPADFGGHHVFLSRC